MLFILSAGFFLFFIIIHKQKGQVIETAGDGFYAVFGLKTNSRTAADQGLKASQLIIKELEAFNKIYLKEYFLIKFEVGIGIHLDKVIAGNIKIGKKNNSSVMGLAVNIASRLQSSTRVLNNNVIVSDAFLKHSSYKGASQSKEINLKGIHRSFVAHLVGKPFKN